jgi:LmbE family N-acetylglucosaminyl deacetylase
MLRLSLDRADPPLTHVLCLGAHCDDLEIGCGGTVMKLVAGNPSLRVTWVVFSADDVREPEARNGAAAMLRDAPHHEVVIERFRDGFFPSQIASIKESFEALKRRLTPDLVLTHWRQDLHQDHRTIGELTWNTFRNHLVLEYEIPKYDGDFGSPNVYVELDEALCRRKIETIVKSYPSQAGRQWFSEDLFRAVLRVRGMEGNVASRHAEGFYCRKLSLS